ncbi:MAG: four helix bundle protein [Sulfurovum sp.]|nr:four helix bundle protein [Sulfurovum sp.]
MTGYENLDVWQKSITLVTDVYTLVRLLPKEERYSLADQIRRSAVSVPSNIAEGSSGNSKKEFVQFLYIALGSLCELETQLVIAQNVGYLNDITNIKQEMTIIKKMLNALITSLKKDQ